MEVRNCWWYQEGACCRLTVTGITVRHMLIIYSCNALCDLIDFDCKDLLRQLCKIAILPKLDYDEISFSMCFHLLAYIFLSLRAGSQKH